MKYAKALLLTFIVSILLGSLPTAVSRAIEAGSTPTAHWLVDAPLIVSAYQRTSDGNGLALLEIFNTSELPVDVTQWQLQATYEGIASGTTKVESVVMPIRLREGLSGVLAPGEHAVVNIEKGILVTNSSYVTAGFEKPVWLSDSKTTPQKGQLTEIALVPLDAGIEIGSYVLKTSSVKINAVTTVLYDELWRRVPQSDGYLSSFYATTLDVEGIYDDGLYTAPHPPNSRIVEVYHHNLSCVVNDPALECGDYIKLWVAPGDEVNKLVIRTDNNSSSRSSSNTFSLQGRTVSSEGYITITYTDTDARLDLTDSGGSLWIEELYGGTPYDGTVVNYEAFTESNKNWAYIVDENGFWHWTTTPQPNGPNKLTEPVEEAVVCPVGKYLNPETGRCRTLEEAVNALAACPEGQYRNPTTNRCKQLAVTALTTLASCGEGQERNPATNRCRSIASAVAELMPCDEGYERNPATNRCRKVAGVSVVASNPTQLVESAKGSGWNVWTWSLVAVAASGLVGYGIYEWRHELFGFGRSIAARFGKK